MRTASIHWTVEIAVANPTMPERKAAKIFDERDNVADAVDELLQRGVVAIEGTKTPAVRYAKRVIECSNVYPDVEPFIGYQNVRHAGYLYYVADTNVFGVGCDELKRIIDQIDADNSQPGF